MKIPHFKNIVPLTALLAYCGCALAQSNPLFGGASNAPASRPAEVLSVQPVPKVPLPRGMKSIFDGKSLDGWTQVPPDSWIVKDGALASRGVGRGVIFTNAQYGSYRIIFDMRHVSGQPDHQACVLVFCTAPLEGLKPLDALGGIQFQVPSGGHWDYRKGHNNAGNEEFTKVAHPPFDVHQWSRVEIVVDAATGIGRMAVAQPVGSKAVEVLDFKDASAAQKGPFALQMHNMGLFDEYANIAIEPDPKNKELITVK